MKPTVLIIGYVYPEPNSSAAGTRMLQLINFFIDKNYKIVFATTCKKSDNAFDLESLNVHIVDILLNDSSFDVFAKELDPSIVLFDRFMTEEQFGWRIMENCPNALRILDTEDLHFVRKARSLTLNSQEICSDDFLFNEITKREIASLYRCDLSLIISESEFQILVDIFKIDCNLLLYLPFMININQNLGINRLKSFADRSDFVSIGNFLHSPNLDAVSYLKKDIWPFIRSRLPKANLHVYGAYDTQAVRSMHNKNDGFLVHGYVEDAFKVVNSARVLLAPLRFGAGLKGKLIQAMQCGTPSVMSTIAAEGIFGSHQPNGFIENHSNFYTEKCINLYSTESIWNDFQKKGFEVLEQRFDKEEFHSKLIDRIHLLKSTLNAHRSTNFIGQLLAYHQFQSTKYMSRWIEEKNIRLK